MRLTCLLALPLVVWLGCSSSDPATPGTSNGDGGGGNGGGASGSSSGTDGGSADDSGSHGGNTTTTPDGGTIVAGNPDGSCKAGVPAAGQLVDVSTPTKVVGTGTAASCTFKALDTAVKAGGIITFDCGSAPTAIAVTATLNLPTDKNTVIDGGGKITLDGGGSVQIMVWNSGNFQYLDTRLTLQNITFANGKIAGSEPIPKAGPPCSQGFNAGEGGALFMRDGNLTVINSIFTNNEAATSGPDVGGGAIRMLGSKHGAIIVGSTFTNNRASNGAAVGCLFSELDVYNSLFDGNTATGHDANNNSTTCKVINNGQNETGSGGNGGALYSDGINVNVIVCGDKVVNNAAGANAFGGGLFFTSNNYGGTLTIADTNMTGNTGGHWTNVAEGATKDAGTAVGTNTKSLTITNSTLQGIK